MHSFKGTDLVTLRANAAMREEDYRIAKKHREEAAEREGSPENFLAYHRARVWEETCYDRKCQARGALIRASEAESAPLAKLREITARNVANGGAIYGIES